MKSPEQEVREGVQAQAHLDIVQPRIDAMKANIERTLFDTKPDQAEDREELYRFHRALDRLIADFKRDIDTGKLAKKQLGEDEDG